MEDNTGVARAFGITTTINFINGYRLCDGGNNGVMRLYRAQNNIYVSASDGPIGTGSGTDRLLATVNPSTLGKFDWNLRSPQTNGSSFAGTNTLTAQDDWGNTVTSFNAILRAQQRYRYVVAWRYNFRPSRSEPHDVLNQAGDFVSGVANLTTQGMTYTGFGGSGDIHGDGGEDRDFSSNPNQCRCRDTARFSNGRGRFLHQSSGGFGSKPQDHGQGCIREHRPHLHRGEESDILRGPIRHSAP